jgi:flagellar protein FliO/FliZ
MKTASLLTRAAALCAALMILVCAPALAAGSRDVENTPVDLGTSTTGGGDAGGNGGSIVRTIVGLAIVIGVIYGIAWVLRQLRASRQARTVGGLQVAASVALGSGRSLQLARVGNELVLVGVGEQGVTPVKTYSEEEAREAGLIDEWGDLILPDDLDGDGAAPTGAKLKNPREVVGQMRKWTVRR